MDVQYPVSNTCSICELAFEQDEEMSIVLTKKGKNSLKKLSELRGDGKFASLNVEKDRRDIIVHTTCRSAYYHIAKNEQNVAALDKDENGQVSNSLAQLDSNHGTAQFDYFNLCIFCAADASETFMWQQLRLRHKNLKANLVKLVSKGKYKEVLHQATVWGEEVFERVIDKDLLSLKARFHVDCFTLHAAATQDKSQSQTKYMTRIVNKLEQEIEDGTIEGLTEAIALKEKVDDDHFDYERHCIICATDTCGGKDAGGGPTLQIHRLTTAATLMKLLNCVSNEEVRSRVTNVVLSDRTGRCHKVCYLRFYETCRGAMEAARRSQAGLDYYSDYIVDDEREKGFEYRAHCLICGRDAPSECAGAGAGAVPGPGAANDVRLVHTQHTGRHLLDVSLRFHDKWREQVRRRVQDKDLISLGARYHKGCYPQLFIPPPDAEARAMETQLLEESIYKDLFRDKSNEDLCDGNPLRLNEESDPSARVRSFDLTVHCIFCGGDASADFVRTQRKKPLHRRVTVQKRIEGYSCKELVAMKLQYHANCYRRFSSMPPAISGRKTGRPPSKDNSMLNWKDWSDIDNGNHTIDHHSDIASSDIRQDSSGIRHDSSVIRQDSSVIRQDSSVIRQDSSVIREDSSVIRQDSSVIRQDSSDIRCDNCDLNEDCHDFNDEHDYIEYEHISFQDFSSNGMKGVADIHNSYQELNLDADHNSVQKSKVLEKKLKCKLGNSSAWCEVVCNVCLSGDRSLRALGRHARIFNAICADVNRRQTLVCWECAGVLRRVEEFRAKAEIARRVLSDWQGLEESKPSSLSTMTVTQLDKFSHDGHSQTDHEGYEGQIYIEIKDEDTKVTSNPNAFTTDDENGQDISSNDNFEAEMLDDDDKDDEDDAFGQSDDNVDTESEAGDDSKRKIDKCEKRESKDSVFIETKRNADKHTDTGSASDGDIRNNAKKHDAVKRKHTNVSDDEDDSSDLDTAEPGTSRDVDSDYEPPKWKKSYDGNEKRKNYVVYEGSTKEVVRRVPIEPHEAPLWMDKERNSEYFKKLKMKKCLLCVSVLVRETREEHIKERHTETFTSRTCPICKIVFGSAEKLDEHVRLHYFVFECTLCGYQCYSKRNMYTHSLARHRRWVQCTQCDAKFGPWADFQKHWREKHTLFDCQLCDCRFRSNEDLDKHIERNHTAHTCLECGKTYDKYRMYQQHVEFKHKIERGEDAFCVSCGVQFDNRAQYRHHLATARAHAAERCDRVDHPCSKCDQVFPSRSKLWYHSRKAHANDKFICAECGKIFVMKAKLQQHIKRVHERVQAPRNKMCPLCGRGFAVRKTLIHHIRTHTGERPYQCPHAHCNAAFAQKAAMQSHVKSRHKGLGA